MINTLIKSVADKLLDALVEQTCDILRGTRDDIAAIRSQLDIIQSNQEMQLASSLKAGLSYLQLGQRQRAIDSFVKAEADDSRNAVVKVILALLIAQDRKTDFAVDRMCEALQMNPFIVYAMFPDNAPHVDGLDMPGSGTEEWSLDLSDKQYLATLETKKKLMEKFIRSLVGGCSTILAASASGSQVVINFRVHRPHILWERGIFWSWKLRGFKPRFNAGDEFVAAMAWGSGTVNWVHQIVDGRLLFATPYWTIIQMDEGSFRLLRSTDGMPASTMGANYFATVLCPNIVALVRLHLFKASNPTFLGEAEIFKMYSAEYRRWYSERSLVEKLLRSKRHDFSRDDEKAVAPPYSKGGEIITVSNRWSITRITNDHPRNPKQVYAMGCTGRLTYEPNT